MLQPLSLEDLKSEAQKQSHLVIRREGETAWQSLKDWKGRPNEETFYLLGKRVLVRNRLGAVEHWYTLG